MAARSRASAPARLLVLLGLGSLALGLLLGCSGVPRSYLDADEKQYAAICAIVSRYGAGFAPDDRRLTTDNLRSWRARLDQAAR